MTEFFDERELYTFYDFVVDRKILANTDTYMQHAKVLYDIHGDDCNTANRQIMSQKLCPGIYNIYRKLFS